MSDPRQSLRTHAANHYMKLKGIQHTGEYLPNTVFNMTGTSFDIPHTPFGPYVIAGFFFAVKHLGLTDQLVMGYDNNQTAEQKQAEFLERKNAAGRAPQSPAQKLPGLQ